MAIRRFRSQRLVDAIAFLEVDHTPDGVSRFVIENDRASTALDGDYDLIVVDAGFTFVTKYFYDRKADSVS